MKQGGGNFTPRFASLAGAADDPRYFQISLPVRPGSWSSSFSLLGDGGHAKA
jgi:hypothetical protein